MKQETKESAVGFSLYEVIDETGLCDSGQRVPSAALVGCRDYDVRLDKTLEEMKYQQTAQRQSGEGPNQGKLQQELIYVRPPKGFTGPTKTFSLAAVEPGKFDLENSFIDEAKQASLHVLARHKKPKAPPKKGPAPARLLHEATSRTR